jgi:acyl-CoA thioesterase I
VRSAHVKAWRGGMRQEICLTLIAGALTLMGVFAIPRIPMAAEASAPKCMAPPDLTRLNLPITRTAHLLASRALITIVALGSSSTAGVGASSTEATYPSRLIVELSRRFRTESIIILNRGVSGERAAEMLARFDESVARERPDLVLWQVGTNAVLRGYEHSKSDALIRGGIRRMKATGADVVLIDPQFAPKVIAKPEIEDMVDLIANAAKQEKVDVFHRFALMRHWHDLDGMPFEAFLSSDGLHMNDWSYNCFAKALADAIADTATSQETSKSAGRAIPSAGAPDAGEVGNSAREVLPLVRSPADRRTRSTGR